MRADVGVGVPTAEGDNVGVGEGRDAPGAAVVGGAPAWAGVAVGEGTIPSEAADVYKGIPSADDKGDESAGRREIWVGVGVEFGSGAEVGTRTV